MKKIYTALALLPVLISSAAAEGPKSAEADRYFKDGQSTLSARKAVKPNTRKAKNVILFVADGMDQTTVTAARIFDGQTRGEEGEENFLSFERFPWIALSKTYNTNAQTPDSAGTMSAMVTGVKTKMGILSLDDTAEVANCASSKGAVAVTVGEYAEKIGLATGVVTTARLTHATPAAVFAHAPDRDWERDTNLTEEALQNGCTDIARQLLEFPYGDGLEVAMGGGRQNFLPLEVADPETPNTMGGRRDQRNLAEEWSKKSSNHRYIWDRKGFDAIDAAARPRVLGLFEPSHMQYEADRGADAGGEPSLAEMTTKAIDILRQDKDGFFLMVEGGRIDHAHHAGNAARALKDTQAFSEAVAAAIAKTDTRDTLIIVTADHGHTLTFAGYPRKGSDILGLATATLEDTRARDGYALAGDGKAYTTLGYANGPGSILSGQTKVKERAEPTPAEVKDINYRQQSAIPSPSESHGGQDVVIYATGPHAHLFGGVVEQSYVFHVIDAALGLRKRAAAK
ncbi:MAG: alkaline phosphatase [Parvularculaceae bacterium]